MVLKAFLDESPLSKMLGYVALTIPNALYVSGSPPAAFCLARSGRHHVVGGLPHTMN